MGVSDQELDERLRSTALYVALQAIAHKKHRPEGYKLTPNEALDIPSQDEIARRWLGLSPDEIIAIDRDYDRDRVQLHDLDLDGTYQSVEQRVESDISEANRS